MRPFQVQIDQNRLDHIWQRVREFRFPKAPHAPLWHLGTDADYLRRFQQFWLNEYDWRAAEGWLNRLPQFMADVDGLDMHFYHVKGKGESPMPLLLLHGWPGSPVEFMEVIEPLTDPVRFGADPSVCFDVVVVSQPGYGFSGKPDAPFGTRGSARYMNKLMTGVLGYDRYFAQGGDWGALTSSWLAFDHADHCAAIHLNSIGVSPGGDMPGFLGSMIAAPETPEELAWAEGAGAAMVTGGAYTAIQSTKPESLSYAMNDSPMGLAAWIIEKLHDWGDLSAGETPDQVLGGMDRMLTNIMHYILNDAFNTAAWFYYGAAQEGIALPAGEKVKVPVGMAHFPHDFVKTPPRTYMEKGYPIIHWTDMERGGHFAAWERPAELTADIRAFFPKVRDQL